MEESIDRKNLIVMKLLHYFITEKNYNPIILQGADNEIWLENMDCDYKIIRIVSNHIHNNEQFSFDLYRTKHVVKKIKKKTFSLSMNVLSIFTDLGDSVKKDELDCEKNIDCISLYEDSDIKKYDFVTKVFPDITKKLKFNEDGMKLFVKITSDINNKNKNDQAIVEDVFSRKEPIVTYILIGINILIYLFMLLTNNSDNFVFKYSTYGPYIIKYNEFYRLITGAFIHGGIFHLVFNCYALYIIGSQIESFMGKVKYIVIYFFSVIVASLFSILLSRVPSIGASGAIFGLMGSLLYFGYHYRVYLGNVIKSQIIPLILLNLLIGFLSNGQIDNFAHIGGLIGGFLATTALGVKYKSSKSEIINGIIISILLVCFLLFLSFKFVN